MKGSPVSSPRSSSPVAASPVKEGRFFGKKEKNDHVLVSAPVSPEPADEREKLRVSITIHDLVGLRLPQGGLFKNTKLYFSVRMLSASGATNQRSSTSFVSALDVVHDAVTFDESFTFNLEFEGQVVQLSLKLRNGVLFVVFLSGSCREVDTAFSYTLSERVVGRIFWQVYSDKLRENKVVAQKFALRHPQDLSRIVEARKERKHIYIYIFLKCAKKTRVTCHCLLRFLLRTMKTRFGECSSEKMRICKNEQKLRGFRKINRKFPLCYSIFVPFWLRIGCCCTPS
jgi:hypothetical protein